MVAGCRYTDKALTLIADARLDFVNVAVAVNCAVSPTGPAHPASASDMTATKAQGPRPVGYSELEIAVEASRAPGGLNCFAARAETSLTREAAG